MSSPKVRITASGGLAIEGQFGIVPFSAAEAPRLLRDLAEATAKVCGWRTLSEYVRPFGTDRVSCSHQTVAVKTRRAREIAAALLIAADPQRSQP